MSTDSEQVSQTLIDDGRKLLEEGDRPGALAHFVMATQLHPNDDTLWMLRAEATDDPREAVECLERALEINPENQDAREKLVFFRLNNLQQEARVSKEDTQSGKFAGPLSLNFRTLVGAFTVIFLAVSIIVVIGVAIIWQLLPATARSSELEQPAPTVSGMVLPPTWTPQPTWTPAPEFTPIVKASWKITKDTSVRVGPSTAYERLGTLSKDNRISIVGRSKDGKFLQIEYPDANHLAWIPVDSAQIENNELAALAIPALVPTLPPAPRIAVVPTAKPTNTPVPPFDFVSASAPRNAADCNRQTGVNGTVYTSLNNLQPVNGVMVRVSAFGQLQSTIQTGVKGRAGYWEWYFTNNTEVIGDIAIINADGTLRSQPVSFHLTSCYGANPANQFTVDFAGTR